MASEWTFESSMRTGMACIGLALGLKAVFGSTDHPLVAKAVAQISIVTPTFIFASVALRGYGAQKRIDDHDTTALSQVGMIILSSSLTFSAIVVGVVLWLL